MKYVVTVNGEKFEVEVEKVDGRRSTGRSVNRKTASEVSEPVQTAPKKAVAPVEAAPSAGSSAIISPMPGNIFDIKVNVGDVVKEGEVVIILEAMKMENEIVAPKNGTVASIKVSKGDAVDTDAILVELN